MKNQLCNENDNSPRRRARNLYFSKKKKKIDWHELYKKMLTNKNMCVRS